MQWKKALRIALLLAIPMEYTEGKISIGVLIDLRR